MCVGGCVSGRGKICTHKLNGPPTHGQQKLLDYVSTVDWRCLEEPEGYRVQLAKISGWVWSGKRYEEKRTKNHNQNGGK